MFCPKCGNADQRKNTYCRQCGIFLPDFAKEGKREISPEEHIKHNIVLSFMTAVVGLGLSVLLFSFFLGKENTPALIYVTAGFLIAMSAWQIQTLWRSFQLRKHFKRQKNDVAEQLNQDSQNVFESVPTKELLNEANFADAVPASIIENTTSRLPEKITRKSS
ncbi:MAG: hypothetical protein M3Q99_10375 [Acidobacteriota bacterium]|nr:hypothetical protein [Acidobacteriota bacterium]